MRRPLIAGNWKMHKAISEAVELASALVTSCREYREIEIMVAPPLTAIAAVRQALSDSPIGLGAQNMHWEDQGAFTGEVSPTMLKDAGCRYVILGHSERRQLFGETDENVNRKVRAAQSHGLMPIVCIGETEEERDRGVTFEVVDRQLTAALEGTLLEMVSAYEPVWAIGTGRTATPAQAQEVHKAIRDRLAGLFGSEAADAVRVLYGGSVKPGNVDELMGEADIDGALVGGASLDVTSFTRICGFERRNQGS